MQPEAADLLSLDAAEFTGLLEKTFGKPRLRKRQAKEEERVGAVEYGVRGTASKTPGLDVRFDKRRSTLWIRQL